jgi:hypothetical protein
MIECYMILINSTVLLECPTLFATYNPPRLCGVTDYTEPDQTAAMKLPTLGFALTLLYLGASAELTTQVAKPDATAAEPRDLFARAGKYKCETGTNHHIGDSCHGSIGDYACDPNGQVVSRLLYRGEERPCIFILGLHADTI